MAERYGKFYLELVNPRAEDGCIHEECDDHGPTYLALRVATLGGPGESFEVAQVNSGGYAEEAMRELIARAAAFEEVP